jgi:hypothetical protein
MKKQEIKKAGGDASKKVVPPKKKGVAAPAKKEVKKASVPPPPPAVPPPPPAAPAAPKQIPLSALSELIKEETKDKFYSLVDNTQGTVSQFMKYMGIYLIGYSEEDMKPEKLKSCVKSVIQKGSRLIFDFGEVDIHFDELITNGVLPKEIFKPSELKSAKMGDSYKVEGEEYVGYNSHGQVWFLFGSEKSLPQWAKDNTEVLIVNPK